MQESVKIGLIKVLTSKVLILSVVTAVNIQSSPLVLAGYSANGSSIPVLLPSLDLRALLLPFAAGSLPLK